MCVSWINLRVEKQFNKPSLILEIEVVYHFCCLLFISK